MSNLALCARLKYTDWWQALAVPKFTTRSNQKIFVTICPETIAELSHLVGTGQMGSYANAVRWTQPDLTFSALSGYALYLWKHMISRDFDQILTGF